MTTEQANGQNGAVPVLELRGLSKSFGGLHAVRDVTFKIMPGDRKAIIGPNGAGKTTLFNLITGIYPSSSGQVLLFGKDVTSWPSHRRTAMGMARTFQITSLFPRLTVLDNVLLAIKGLEAVEVRDVAVSVVLQGGLREGAPACSSRRHFSTAPTPRFAISVARRAAPARDRAGARERPEHPAARRAGGRACRPASRSR